VVDELAPDIVIISGDHTLRRIVADAARAEDLVVVDETDADATVPTGGHVVVVDVDDAGALARVRTLLESSSLTAPAVVAVSRTIDATSQVLTAATHWLVWPATAAHVRTKLRAAVLGRACRWLTAPLPDDEDARLRAVHALGVLDTTADPRFEHITDRVCREFRVPVGLITIVDRDRQWFMARTGIDVRETSRDESFCAHAILTGDVMQVPDTLDDPRFADNPAVTGPPRVRFYAGAPIVLDDGSRIGTLCIIDHRPRLLDAGEVARLRALADEVAVMLQQTSVGAGTDGG
jgi:GAF domain-containing protein